MWLKRFRLFFAVVSIVLFSSIFIIPQMPQKIASLSQFAPNAIGGVALLSLSAWGVLFVIIVMTLLFGRVYCSFICPLGIAQDVAIYLAKNRKGRRGGCHSSSDRYLFLRYSILLITVVLLLVGFAMPLGIVEPFSIFGRFITAVIKPVFVWINNFLSDSGLVPIYPCAYSPFSLAAFLLGFGSFVAVLVFAFFRNRLFCNSLCPVGTLLGLLSRFSLVKIVFNQSDCVQCGQCTQVCKANCIDYENKTIDYERCVACFNCLNACGPGAIAYGKSRLKYLLGESTEKVSVSRRRFVVVGGAAAAAALISRKVIAHDASCNLPVMPPGARNINRFTSACTACHLCVSNCPGNVLKPALLQYGIAGYMQPRLDFEAGMCEYDCTLCTEICPSGALTRMSRESKQTLKIGTARFCRRLCVVRTEGTHCGACAEICPTGAVHMVPWHHGLTIPQVEPEQCIGCGACEHVCPVRPQRAITVRGVSEHTQVQMPENNPAPVPTVEGEENFLF